MSIRQISRPSTPASSIKGLGPLRTPRSRPSLSLLSSSTVAAGLHVDGVSSEHQAGAAASAAGHRGAAGARAYRHRKSASQPQQPLEAPKPRVWQHSSSTVVPYSDDREGQSQQHPAHYQQQPPVSNPHHFARPSFAAGAQTAIRSSLQSIARSGSFSLLKTPRQHQGHRRNNSDQSGGGGSIYHYSKYNSDHTHDDLDAVSDGSRFDLLDSDPFRSESPAPEGPAPVVDIVEDDDTPPPVPPKPLPPPQLQIAPTATQTATSEQEDNDADDEIATDGSRTPTAVTASMKQAFSRITGGSNGKSRIRLLSFIKEVRSPTTVEPEAPVAAPPQLTLPTFQSEGPLFDASKFDINDFSKSPALRASNLLAFPTARTPTLRGAPSLGQLDNNTSALQLNLHGDIESYMIPSDVEPEEQEQEEHEQEEEQEDEQDEIRSTASTGIAIIAPTPPPSAVAEDSAASKVAPEWIMEFREELERLAGEALNLTSFHDRLVLELPSEEPGRRRRTLIFQEAEPLQLMPEIVEEEPQEPTPALTSDSVSVTSIGSAASGSTTKTSTTKSSRPPIPTRPIPPVPVQEVMESGVSEFERFWRLEAQRRRPHGYNEAGGGRVESLYTIQSHSTFDPTQPIPSIPDQDSYFGTVTDDEDEVRTIHTQPANDSPDLPPVPSASIQPTLPPLPARFQPRLSKQEAIEEAIRKFQRKAQEKRISLSVASEEESDEEEENGPKTPQQANFQSETYPGNLSLFRTASNPFVTPFESTKLRPKSLEPPPKHRKVSLLRKRVLSRSIGSSSSKSDSGHTRSFSEPTESSESLLKERNVVVAGRLPLTTRPADRLVPILKTPVTAPSTTSYFPHHQHTFPPSHGYSLPQQPPHPQSSPPPAFSFEDHFNPPVYLASSTPTFEVIPPAIKRNYSSSAAVYYPVDSVTRTPSYRRQPNRPSPSNLVVEL
ncbi:hypothetical protein FRC17_009112 [Serendipita sp. 399]|nr:hypothetical protein FRC17_009112 [Serendipita sp. 399]